jgi:hypothetical protein
VNALKAAERKLRAALKLAMGMQDLWEQEHIELLTHDVHRCRVAVEALEHLLRGDSSLAEALLATEEAQRKIHRERLQNAIRQTARRHGWRAS